MGAIVSSPNWADSGTITVQSGVGQLLPIGNAQKAWCKGLARMNASEFYIDVNLGALRRIVCVGLRGLNGNYADATISFSAVAAGGSELGTEFVYYGDSGPNVGNDWQDTFGTALWWTGAPKFARYVRIALIMESTPSNDTWTDIRRVWVGGGFEVAEGVDAGWTLDFVDGSTADRSPNGAVFAYPGATWRRMKVALTLRPESQLAAVKTANVGPMWVVLAKIGRGSEVVVAPRSMDAGGWYYLGVLHGQLTEWSPLAFLPGSLASMESATFEEIPIEPLS